MGIFDLDREITLRPGGPLATDEESRILLDTLERRAQSLEAAPVGGGRTPMTSEAQARAIAAAARGEIAPEIAQAEGSALLPADILAQLVRQGQAGTDVRFGALPEVTLGELAPAPTIAAPEALALAPESRFIPQQAELISGLEAAAAGRQPSVAEGILRAQQQENLRRQMALAASLGGRALPAAQRQIMQQAAMSGQQIAQQAAIARAQEQAQAQQLLASALAGARGQDIERARLGLEADRATQAAQQAIAIRQAELEAERTGLGAARELEQVRLQEQARREREALEADIARARIAAAAGVEQQQIAGRTQAKAAERQKEAQILGGILGAAGAVGAAAV